MPVEDSDISEFADPERIVGNLIAGRYLVQRCIASGGMGVVYLAWQLGLGRHVVLKVIRADRADRASRLRFRREAYNLSRLAHPNVVNVYDHGVDDATGLLYLVMEHVSGLTLRKFQRQLGRLSVEQLVPIASPLLGGLAEIHRSGLIHRDIKASNVMLSSDDGHALQVKIVDFGLSKQLVGDETATRPSEVLGSHRSVAPEVFKGEAAGPSADVYAAGVLLYELVAGHDRVRTNSPYERMVRSANGDFTPLEQVLPHEHGIPPKLIELVHQCLEAQPEKRPANGLELASRFERAVAGVTPDAFEAAATAERARPLLPIPTAAAVRRADEARARASTRGPWPVVGLLAGAFGAAFLVTLLVLLVVRFAAPLWFAPAPEPVEANAPAKTPELYREWALAALRDGDYELAVALLSESIAQSGEASGDVVQLLELATELRDREPEPEPGRVEPVQPEPEPATGALVVAAFPRGVAFEVLGVARGRSPSELASVPAGTHTVRFFDEETVLLEQRVEVVAGEIALLQVNVAPEPEEPERTPEVWAYLPGRAVPRALRDAFSPARVLAFDSYASLAAAVSRGDAQVIVAPRETLGALGVSPSLRALGTDRQPTAPHVVVSRKGTRENALYRPGTIIAALDVAGGPGTRAYVRRVMDLPHEPTVRVVQLRQELVTLLVEGEVDASLMPADLAGMALRGRSKLVLRDAPTPAGLLEVAVLDESLFTDVEVALQGLEPASVRQLGVATWTR